MKEKTWFLTKCKEDILKKYVGDSLWQFSHSDFEKLSDEIYEVSKISVSVSTLKRIWKDNYKGNPNISTLDAFGIYLGYKNWRDYCNNISNKPSKRIAKKQIKLKKQIILFISMIILVSFVYILLKSLHKFRKTNEYSNIEFYFQEFDSTKMPVYAIFKYNLHNIKCSKATIRPYGTKEHEFEISPDDSIATFSYVRPWNYFPSLVIDGEVIKSLQTSFVSGVWKAGLSNARKEFFIEYFDNPKIFTGGTLGFSKDVMSEITFPLKEIDFVTFDLFKRFENINGDSLYFKMRVKNTPIIREKDAGRINLLLCFEQGDFAIPFTLDKSPTIPLSLVYFGNYLDGKNNNLSFLFQNTENWMEFTIKTNNKAITLYINDSLVYNGSFEVNPGILKGIMYDFIGLGEIDYVRFYNTNGDLIYNDEFD